MIGSREQNVCAIAAHGQSEPSVSDLETSPLLGDAGYQPKEDGYIFSFGQELRHIISASTTITAGYFLQQSLQLTNIFIVGRLGSHELSVVAFGFMIATCTAWPLALGGTTAIDSIGSLERGKGGGKSHIGILLQRYLITVTALFIPVALLWFFSASLLLQLHISPDLAYDTQTFLRYLTPFAVGYILFEALKKFLQCQEIRAPGTIILLIASLINIPLTYICVHVLHGGVAGGLMAIGSMYWLCALLTLVYISASNASQAWDGWSKDSLQDLGLFARAVLFGIVSIGAEWWAFEIITIMAGTMGEMEAAAQAIVMTTDTLLALFPFGVGIATTNRVAGLVGAGHIAQAKRSSRAASLLASINGVIAMLVLSVFRRPISRWYTTDPKVIEMAVAVFPWGAAFQVSDGLQCVNAGTLRAVGKVDLAMWINLAAYYVVAIPLASILAFQCGLGVSGLWISLAIALTLAGVCELLLVNCMKWTKLSSRVVEDSSGY
ncbi:putative multidrug resistance pump [Lophiostoma macrostomum CBS 122681]|uniref:Putative multidrug resistance pump n=1 Tax=Lophiostoma macrostomum CBS 122681 TaxID=1314788 RepID=A0A6A6SHT8_9PLEO|nr:putative multidrug resistance pump [Lophiostoma macrostomum CBS 122681]